MLCPGAAPARSAEQAQSPARDTKWLSSSTRVMALTGVWNICCMRLQRAHTQATKNDMSAPAAAARRKARMHGHAGEASRPPAPLTG